MNEEFLQSLGLEEDAVSAVMSEYNRENLNRKLSDELKNSGACDTDAVMALIDTEDMNDENIKDKINTVKQAHPKLFEGKKPRFVSPAKDESVLSKSDFDKMSYRQRLEYFQKNPEGYKRLV